MDQNPRPEVYQLHVWLRQISQMIWRRFLIRSDSALTDLHNSVQIAFGWSDFHLHRFRIRGQDYSVGQTIVTDFDINGDEGCPLFPIVEKASVPMLLNSIWKVDNDNDQKET